MLDPGQIDTYREALLSRRETLQAERAREDTAEDEVTLDQSRVGRVSRVDALQQHAMHNAAQARRQAELTLIAAALERIEAGTYGSCPGCGKTVASARLDFNPALALCIDCAEAAETG